MLQAQAEYQNASTELFAAHKTFEAEMRSHLRSFESIAKEHTAKLKDATLEVLRIEQAEALERKRLIEDICAVAKDINKKEEAKDFVARNIHLKSKQQTVICIRRSSPSIAGERVRHTSGFLAESSHLKISILLYSAFVILCPSILPERSGFGKAISEAEILYKSAIRIDASNSLRSDRGRSRFARIKFGCLVDLKKKRN